MPFEDLLGCIADINGFLERFVKCKFAFKMPAIESQPVSVAQSLGVIIAVSMNDGQIVVSQWNQIH